jgi:hypothetical protein
MTRYTILSSWQLMFLVFFMSILTAVLVSINSWFIDYRTLPMVYKDAGVCTKVENFENGHAFNCHDVDVTLRRYRMPDEKILPIPLHFLQKGS